MARATAYLYHLEGGGNGRVGCARNRSSVAGLLACLLVGGTLQGTRHKALRRQSKTIPGCGNEQGGGSWRAGTTPDWVLDAWVKDMGPRQRQGDPHKYIHWQGSVDWETSL